MLKKTEECILSYKRIVIIESLSDRQWYVCSHFKYVSTAIESDVESGRSKGAHEFCAGKVECYTSTMLICIL